MVLLFEINKWFNDLYQSFYNYYFLYKIKKLNVLKKRLIRDCLQWHHKSFGCQKNDYLLYRIQCMYLALPLIFHPSPICHPCFIHLFSFFFLFFVFDVCLCVATLFVFLSGTMRRIRDVLQLRRVCVTSEFPSRTRWPKKKKCRKKHTKN